MFYSFAKYSSSRERTSEVRRVPVRKRTLLILAFSVGLLGGLSHTTYVHCAEEHFLVLVHLSRAL